MKKFLTIALALIPVLFLAACGNRPGWDERLARGCDAAVAVMIKDNQEFRVKNRVYASETSTENEKLRIVTLEAELSTNKRRYVPVTYKCYFNEEISLFGLAWRATLYRLEMGKETYGNKDGNIVGDFNDFMKLTTAVNNAL